MCVHTDLSITEPQGPAGGPAEQRLHTRRNIQAAKTNTNNVKINLGQTII